VSRPRPVLVALGVATLLLAGGIPRLTVDSSVESMIVAGNRDHEAFDAYKEIFGSDEIIAVAIPFGDALAPESLRIQLKIAERVERLVGVTGVDALPTVDDIFGEGESLVVDPLIPPGADPRRLTPAEQTHIRERVSTNSIWSGALISRDGTSAALQVHLEEPQAGRANRGEVVSQIEKVIRDELGTDDYFLAGHPFMKTEIARTMRRDLSIFLPVTITVMALLLLAGVGSVGMAALLLCGVLTAVLWMLGIMGWLGQPLTALSNTGPTILLALGTAYFMHLAAAYQRETEAGGGPAEVVRRALTRVRRPTVVAGVTTAIGFGSLVTSEIPLVKGFGLDLSLGVFAILVIACFGIPAALVLISPQSAGGTLARGILLGRTLFRLSSFDVTRASAIVLVGAGLLVGCSMLALRLKIDSSGPRAFAKESPFRRSSEFYRQRLSGDVIENIYLEADEEGAFKDPTLLGRMLALQREAEALPEIDKTSSIANYVAMMNRAIYGNDPSQERLPDTRAAVAQYLLLYSMSGDLENFDELVDGGYRRARIVLNATVPSSAASAALRVKLGELAHRYFPGEFQAGSVLSTEILLSQAADSVAREQARSFAGALVLIVLVVMVAFRSVLTGALLLLPNALPIAVYLGTMVIAGLALSESTSVIAVIGLGIAVDSTVHLIAAIRRSEQTHGSLPGAIVEAMQVTGRPVVITGLTVVLGFSVLLLSDFKLISDFGGLTALTILYCLGADLVVLPAQLLVVRRFARKEGIAGESREWKPALLSFEERAMPALLVQRSGEKASFRLLGEENGWRGWHEAEVRVDWLDNEPRGRGQIAGVDEVATPVLRVEWDDRSPGEDGEKG